MVIVRFCNKVKLDLWCGNWEVVIFNLFEEIVYFVGIEIFLLYGDV